LGIKTIKPASFHELDMSCENYTEQLWIFEGFTSYYDELVFEVNASKADEFADKIKDLMQNAYQLDIPLKVLLFWVVQYLKNTLIFTNFILMQNNYIMPKVIKLKFLGQK
jgi:hypothetical protein